jgi:hypothetical protein
LRYYYSWYVFRAFRVFKHEWSRLGANKSKRDFTL